MGGRAGHGYQLIARSCTALAFVLACAPLACSSEGGLGQTGSGGLGTGTGGAASLGGRGGAGGAAAPAGSSGARGGVGGGIGGDVGPGGAPGGAGGATAEIFICATSMFSFSAIGTAPVLNAYVLTLTPATNGYVGQLRLEAAGSGATPAPPPPETVAINGVVGRNAIDVAFPGGSVQVTPLPGAAAGILDGDARFERQLYGARGPVDSVAVACWSSASGPRFHYDLDSGRCIDGAGIEGRQAVTVPMLRETGDGECATVSAGQHVDPSPLIPGRVLLNEIDVGYPSLVDWNLKGATLAGTSLYFAMLLEADLRGTDLTGFMPGYHAITATIDAHTTGIDAITCITGTRSAERWACCTVGGVVCE